MSTDSRSNGRAVTPPRTPSRGPEPSKNAQRHGAYSEAALAECRGQHLDRLKERFPAADVTVLGLQATRLAQLELVGAWLDGKGIIRNKRHGTIWPAAEYWNKVASAFERQHERLDAQASARGGSGPTLADIQAEYAADGEK